MADQLSVLNPEPRRMSGAELLHQLVSQTEEPDALAIEHLHETGVHERLSYDKLRARSGALAGRLRSAHQSIAPPVNGHFIVPLYIHQCPDLYVSQLAVLQAGGAFCPIALDAPEERLRFVLRDVNASILLTHSTMRGQLPQLDGIQVIEVDRVLSEGEYQRMLPPIEPSKAAYIMYTSGSTGTPKGVIISHLAASQALLAHDRHIPQFSRFLQFANPTFDVSVFEIFFPLFRGATLVTCDRRRLLNDLPGVINQLGVDAAELTPSVASSLLHDRKSVPSLQLLLTIGEMLKKSVVDEFAGDATTPGILHGMYGPTEATIHCTLQTAFTNSMPVNNIGTPLDTVSTFIFRLAVDGVFSESPEIVPIGEEGELVVGGHQLADGYLNRDEQTKAAFFRHSQFGRLYRTGDRARMTADGKLECLGRISSGQVKLRGQRIELGEIEHAAGRTQGCRAVVADIVDGVLVVFCVCTDSTTTVDDIRQCCRKWLPAFMVPGDFVLLEGLPYLASGKVDRKALSGQYQTLQHSAPTDTNTGSVRVQDIAAAVSEVLRIDINANTHLPSAGLDSLSAIRVASQLNRRGFPQIDANTILEARSVCDIDAIIAEVQQSAQASGGSMCRTASSLEHITRQHPLLMKEREDVERLFETTALQSAMLGETARDPQAYCNWLSFEVAMHSDISKVEKAIRELSRCHELLRSGFVAPYGSNHRHAVVVWKRLLRSQVIAVEEFDYGFTVDKEEDALRPCRFQLRRANGVTRILLKIHHALYDQWSIDVLKADLYSLLRGETIDYVLPFSKVSTFYTSNLEDARHDQVIDFWQDHLRDFTTTPVPNLNSRAVPRKLARTPWKPLSLDMHTARSFLTETGYSMPALFQAAVAYLVAAYTGSKDVTFGTVLSGRHIALAGIERTFGPCLATLPCRIDLSGLRSCRDLLRLTQDRNRAMQRHSLTPLAEIKKAGQCSPGTTLFDMLFVWQETSLASSELEDCIKETDSADHHEFNLVIEFDPSNTALMARATYQESLLPSKHAETILQQIGCLADHLLQHLDDPVTTLASAFTPDLLSMSNQQFAQCASSDGVGTIIECRARQSPDSLALIFATRIEPSGATTHTLTYADLEMRANRLAHFLSSCGVRPNNLVCVCMEKSIDLYVAILAAIKSGAGYLPLVPDTPPARLQTILRQAGVKVCLCDRVSAGIMRSISSASVVQVDQLNLQHHPSEPLAVPVTGSDIAYTVFTSGSTGEPKGVAVTRGNLAGNLAALSELYNVAPGDRLLQACSQAFDVSVFEIFFAFSSGMCLCAATKDDLFYDLERSIRALGVTHLSLTPTVAGLVNPANVPSVRFLVTAGEGVTDLVRRTWAGKGLHQGYGPSETTNICTINMAMSPDDVIGNIGVPLRNTSAFVISLDEEVTLLPIGAIGELAFGGEQVFRGYLGMDDLNAAKIINHPKYGRIYRSGDIGRLLCNGSLLITGRLDEQVKLRGNRVELGEINAVMLQDAGVVDSATQVFQDQNGGLLLAVFWVPKMPPPEASEHTCVAHDHQQAVARLFQHLETALPAYMLPSSLIPITRMPLTLQGKLDRRLLRHILVGLDAKSRQAFSRNLDDTESDDEWSSDEHLMASALAEVLHVPRSDIRRTTSFFSLGLNSLSAIAFAKAMEVRLEKRISIDTVLRHPSIARLATTARQGSPPDETKMSAGIPSLFAPSFASNIATDFKHRGQYVQAVLPCTPLQEAMLSTSVSQGPSAYRNSTTFKSSADVGRLKQCWTELVARHAILRTQFVETTSAAHPYAQVVLKHKTLPWHLGQNGDNGYTEENEPCCDQSALVTMSEPWNAQVQCTSSGFLITLHMHHAIYDGISMSLLLEEIEGLYHGHSLPAPASFEPFLSEVLEHSKPEALQFWSTRLRDYSPKPFPSLTQTEEPSVERILKQSLPALSTDLETFCKRYSVATLSVFQAAWAKVLSCCQQAEDVCFGSVVSGRSVAVPDIERLVAPCFNTIPVRINLDQCRNNAHLAQALHAQNIEDMRYQLTSLRHIQTLSQTPDVHLFDSILLLQPPQKALDPSIWAVIGEEGTMDMPVVVEIIPEKGDFTAALHFLTSHVSEEVASLLMHAFTSALSACLHYSSSSLDSFYGFDSAHLAGQLRTQRQHRRHKSSSVEELHGNAETWTPEQTHVREVFANLSNIDAHRITKDTSMYRLGLDSLNAAQIAARLRQLGLDVDATDIIQGLTPLAIGAAAADRDSPTKKQLQNIDLPAFDARHRHCIGKYAGLKEEAVEAVRPCTAVQCGMIAQSVQSCGSLYVNHVTYEIPDGVSVADSQKAWSIVQRKHPALRMGFCPVDDPNRPFAMVLSNTQAVKVDFTSFESCHDLESIEAQAAEDIVRHLHRPAWRVATVQSTGRLVMVLSLHHALYDAESLQFLLTDFVKAINSQHLGPATSIDSLLTCALSAETAHRGEAATFWRESLGAANVVKFPNLSPSQSLRSEMRSTKRTSSLPASMIEEYCRQEGATIQAIGQATWALLVSAYTGEPNLIFGTVFSGRSGMQGQATAFPSLSTVPVHCAVNKPGREVVADMVAYNASMHRYRFTPLADIQRSAGMANRSLFDTVFVYQKSTSTPSAHLAWPMVQETAAVDYVASLELEMPAEGGILFHLTVDVGRIPRVHAELMLRQYDYTLAQLVGHSGMLTNDIPSLLSISPARKAELLSDTKLLHHFVEAGAREHPHRPALEFVEGFNKNSTMSRTWTYQGLDQRANQVAHLLRGYDVKAGSIVAVRMHKCAEATFAFIGILKAGYSFLALDPELPEARQRFILQDSGASILLLDSQRTKAAPVVDTQAVQLSEPLLHQYSKAPVEPQALASNATCYCLYTSGTTGAPKGCEITHENAVQAMLAFQQLFAGHWDRDSRWLQFASYWFDVSVLEQFWSWSVGITVVGAPRDVVLDDLAGFIKRARVTHIDLTPSLARLLHPDDVPSLHNGVFITGGEALKQEIIDTWGPKHVICNGYGPTEATIGVTMNPFIGPDAKPSNIGRQFDNVGAYALAPETDEPVLRGAIGELCVSGKLVGKGYLNRPELTAKAFPFLTRFGERVYRTGDLVRLLADGSFAFVGRKDTQAKLRGQRLEIGEIDSVIEASSESIVDIVSLVIKDDSGGKETLVSFMSMCNARNGEHCQIDTSQRSRELVQAADRACGNHLPAYMVPTHIIPIDFLPLTVNNKTDGKRLIELFGALTIKDLQSLKNESNTDAALSDNERRICHVLSEMLNLDAGSLGPHANIFSLGMSSVSAITFASLLKRHGFDVASVALVMKIPTIRELARALSGDQQNVQSERNLLRQAQLSITAFAQRHRNAAAQRLLVSPDDIEAITPCTPLQEGLIFESLRNPEQPYFNEFRYLLGKTDLQRLGSAFGRLVAGVQVLRSRFVQNDDGFAQVVLRQTATPWWILSTAERDAGLQLAEERRRWLEDNQQDLVVPIKAVVSPSTSGNVLAFFVHHALYDGISWQLLLDRLAEAYHNKSLPSCGPNFTDALPYGPLRSRQDAKPFWQHRLARFLYKALPHVSRVGDREVATASLCISDTGTIEPVRKRLGVSHQALMQACFEVALQHHYPETRTYGQVVFGRSTGIDGADKVIGPLFNTLPHVIDRGTEDTWATVIRRSHEANAAALSFQHTPLKDIRKWCNQRPSDPMFDVLFVFQHQPERDITSNYGLWKPLEDDPHADYPLAFEITLLADNSLELVLVAQSDVADHESLNTLLRSFRDALVAVGQDMNQQIAHGFNIPHQEEKEAAHDPSEQSQYVDGVNDFTWTNQAEALRAAIAQVAGLGTMSVDQHSSIFALGLDSIDAVKLASRIKKAGLSLPVSKILQAQTIPRMLDAVQDMQAFTAADGSFHRLAACEERLNQSMTSNISDRGVIERVLPATPSQEALLADMLRSEWQAYYNHDILRLRPDTDLDKLRAAWQKVVDGSPILRTAFLQVTDPDIDATFAQVIHRPHPLQFEEQTLNSREDMPVLLMGITHDAMSKFESECFLRLTLATVQTDRYLILSLAHAQYDGHSLALLHEDVRHAYEGTWEERPPCDKVIEDALGATSEEARNFWSNTLSGATTSNFPRSEGKGGAGGSHHRAEHAASISSDAARSFCQRHGFSVQALAQTCWSLLLAHYMHSLEVLFGVVLACRDSEEAEQVIFPAMNTVPIRAALHGSRSEMLRYMQSMINDMRPYQKTPLRTIQTACAHIIEKNDRFDAGGSLFDTLFVYQHRPGSAQDDSEPLYESVGGSSSVEYPVAVEMEAIGAQLLLRAACKGSVLDEHGTSHLIKQLDRVLSAVVEYPHEPTVAFFNSEVSVCGLPRFQLPSKNGTYERLPSAEIQDDGSPADDELSPTAVRVREALAQVAKVPADSISPSAPIESIGIDSISAIKVAAILRKQDVALSVSGIIRAKTVVKMAELATAQAQVLGKPAESSKDLIAQALQEHDPTDINTKLGVDRDNVETILPATAGQVYMLSVWNASAGQLFYPTFSYELQASVTVEQIREAWDQLVARHAILRTVFCATQDEQIPVLQVVLKDLPDSNFHVNDQAPAANSGRRPMAALHVTKREEGYHLGLKIHHALYDAVSLPLLMSDFQAAISGIKSTLPASQLEDSLALSVTKEAQQSRKAFWTSYLQEISPAKLQQPKSKGAQRRVEIFMPGVFRETSVLESIARKESVTIQALLFAAYAKVYAHLATGSDSDKHDDVVLGIYLSNRSHLPELDRLAAPTLNLVPLLVRSPSQRPLLEVARQIHVELQDIGTVQNSAVGLWEIAAWTGVKVDTFVNFLKLPEQSGEDEVTAEPQSGVMLREMDDRRTTTYSRVSEPNDGEFVMPKELQDMGVVDAYQHSLDLEATVVNGALDVGLFCPEEMLGLSRAEEVVEEIGGLLEKLVGKAKG